ncbi:MAG: hypothetical protein DWQ02_26940 [Bacteroidetes bacterium]|nr:MAG: hypothetical protein DWQ02_26940 [Bacteroidota bacterium]
MKKLPLFPSFFSLLSILLIASQLLAQDPIPVNESTLPDERLFPEPDCIENPCPCEGGLIEVKLFYFGDDAVDIEFFGDAGLTNLIGSETGINNGDMFIVNGTGTPLGKLYSNTYLRVTNSLGETCVVKIFTRCPTNSWPGAYDDLRIVGKTYGDFIVYSKTDLGNNNECTIADVDQDWHVGGNIIDPAKNTMGTRNEENVVFITDDTPRGVITASGDYGINTMTPSAKLHVQGDQIIEETLDVNGIARMNSGVASTAPTNGALIVTGGTGISEDLNVGNNANIGNDLDVTNNGTIGVDLAVGNNGSIGNDLDVGNDAFIHNNLTVSGIASVTNPLGSSSPTSGALVVTGGAGIGENLNVGLNGYFGGTLSVGILSPARKVHASGDGIRLSTPGNDGRFIELRTDGTGTDLNSVDDDLYIRSLNEKNVFINSLDDDGKVAIGTLETPGFLDDGAVDITTYKLFVKGGILTEEVRVRAMPWPDYVFLKDYPLLSLESTKTYILNHGHLPNTPTAAAIEAGGLPLSEATVNQQEKIEEIFLHLIEMNEQIKLLKQENELLKARMEQMANQK